MKTRSSSPNLSKLARADISCQFMKKRSLCRHCLQNEWTLVISFKTKFMASLLMLHSGSYAWIISYSKCLNWHRISKLLSNFGCLLTCCYFDRANSIETNLQTLTYKPSSQLVTSSLSNFD
jgi:hypothetical protein